MTLQRDDASGTARFIPPTRGAPIDVLGTARPSQIAPSGRRRLPPWPVTVIPVGKDYPGLYYWRIWRYDEGGGVNKMQRGRWSEVHDLAGEGDWSSKIWEDAAEGFVGEASAEQQLTNLLKTTEAATPDIVDSESRTLFFTEFLGQTLIGVHTLDAPWNYFFGEDPDTGALTELPFGGTGSANTLTGMTSITDGDGTTWLALQFFGGVGVVLLDAAPGSQTAVLILDATQPSSRRCWGLLNTTLDDFYLLWKGQGSAGGASSYWCLPRGAAVTAAATERQTGIPQGGYLVGLSAQNGSTTRVYWNRPPDNAPNYAALPGSLWDRGQRYRGILVSTLQDGTDEQPYLELGLDNHVHSTMVRGGIVSTDEDTAVWGNGRVVKTFDVFKDAPANSDIVRKIKGWRVISGRELFALVNEYAAEGATGDTVVYEMRYDWDLDTWQRSKRDITIQGTSGPQSFEGGGGLLPFSRLTRNSIDRIGEGTSGSWFTQYRPPAGTNPFNSRITTGAAETTGREFEEYIRDASPVFQIDGLEHGEYLVTGIYGPPVSNIAEGGAGAWVRVACGGKDAKFTAQERSKTTPYKKMPRHGNWVQELQIQVEAQRTTTGSDPTRHAMNVFPVSIEGFFRTFDAGKDAGLEIPEDWSRE